MMKNFIWFVLILTLVGCATNETRIEHESNQQETPWLENLGIAPELTNEVWLNPEKPLHLADLRGKVVLLEMWTFG